MVCHACSSSSTPEARYCPYCGSRLAPGADPGPDFQSAARQNDRFAEDAGSSIGVQQSSAPNGCIRGPELSHDSALRELKQIREAFRLITETIQEVFYIAQPSITCAEYVSPGYETVWGRSRQSLYDDPKSFFDAVYPEDLPVALTMMEHHQQLQSFECQYRIVRPDGEIRWIRDRGYPARDATGTVTKYVGVAQDITDFVLAQEQVARFRDELAQLSRLGAMGEFSAGIAHELNQPLTAIANNAYVLRDLLKPAGDGSVSSIASAAADLATQIEKQSLRAGDILRGLHAMVQGKPAQRSPASLQTLLESVTRVLSTTFHQAEIEFSARLHAELPDVFVNHIQIQQVLFNLLQNSVDAMRDQPGLRHLLVSAEPADGQIVRVRVRDTGPGVSEHIRAQLFTPFRTTKTDGMGFGLAITRRIIEAHGGAIEVNPQATPGVEVTFTLPTTQ